MNVVTITRDQLNYNYALNFSPENTRQIGKRAADFLAAIDVLVGLFKDQSENSLYLKLKIELWNFILTS